MASNGVHHRMGAPFHPSTNGLAERLVQAVKKALKKMKNEPGSLQSKLSKFLFNYRNTPHPSTGDPPTVLLIGRLLRSHLDLLRPEADSRISDVVPAAFINNKPLWCGTIDWERDSCVELLNDVSDLSYIWYAWVTK